ncbi:MAG: lipooligosaccharide transport system permease protein [Frankiales bacterium]|jgi:lipooligosaccharide transport system permease protein|nr:lipooligosaccharide transport system permease protein [Frankiales bacterium]
MSHPTVRSFEYWAYQYKRTWRGGLVTGVLSPVLFLAAMGVGLGGLVNSNSSGANSLGGVSYLVFLAPGLLAANAMQVGVQESTYPVMGAIKWIRTYHAMLATPLRVIDVLLGHLLWIALRVLMVCAIFLGVMAAFGTTKSWTALLTLPAGLLTGIAFATPIVAYAATQERDSGFNAIFRFGVMPLFLFSGTFFPVSQLPSGLQPVAYATPLWHGVDLCRTLALGTAEPLMTLGHVSYLLGLTVIGVAVATRTFRTRLET